MAGETTNMRLSVKVNPNSSHRKGCWRRDHLKVNLISQPEEGKANRELVKYLSGLLNLHKQNIEIKHGETSRNKELLLKNVDRDIFVRTMNRLREQEQNRKKS